MSNLIGRIVLRILWPVLMLLRIVMWTLRALSRGWKWAVTTKYRIVENTDYGSTDYILQSKRRYWPFGWEYEQRNHTIKDCQERLEKLKLGRVRRVVPLDDPLEPLPELKITPLRRASRDFLRITELETENAALKAQVISGFYEEEVPQFTQGIPTHELQSVVTAQEVTGYVSIVKSKDNEIRRLNEILEYERAAHRTAQQQWSDRMASKGGSTQA